MYIKPKTKTIIAIIIVVFMFLSILFSALYPVFAATKSSAQLKKEYDALKKQTEAQKKTLLEIQKKKKYNLEQITTLNDQINTLNNEIEQIEGEIEILEKEIIQTQEDLKIAESAISTQEEGFKERARIMYEHGTVSYLEVLLGANSFSDFLTRVDIVRDVVRHDKDVLNEMLKTREKIVSYKKSIEHKKQETILKREVLDEKMETLKIAKEASEEAYEEYNKAEKEAQAKVAEAQKKESDKKKEYERALAEEKAEREAAARVQKEILNSLGNTSGTKYEGGTMAWPVPAVGLSNITSQYGNRYHPVLKRNRFHSGIDIGAPYGSSIVAANDGTVIKVGYDKNGYGNYLIINHGGGVTTLYGHCSKILVKTNDTVKRGQEIAKVGSTGLSTGNHLHFEVSINGQTQNPMNYLK
ncbi:MAG: peptidoglycan DD-metalloendopeptidase family protein [Clostridiaceae bacterium]|nr:peptidoglycan DD-metalloendopeptidase family protein [Clostridiaceae bacterium]